jgi:hypothetical protein
VRVIVFPASQHLPSMFGGRAGFARCYNDADWSPSAS